MRSGESPRRRAAAICLVLLCVIGILLPRGVLTLEARAESGDPRVLDDFADVASWKIITADGVECRTQADRDESGAPCLRIDFNFVSGAGYCIVQKAIRVDLPAAKPEAPGSGNYELAFDLKADAPVNNLEFKLLDTRGDAAANAEKSDVWWHNRRAFQFPREWTTLASKRRHVQFAWGPSGGTPLTHVDKIEFAIASSTGGKGTVWLRNLRIREIAAPPQPLPRASATVSSGSIGSAADAGDLRKHDALGAWLADGSDTTPTLTIDYGYEREIGGVRIRFVTADAPVCTVQASNDGRDWNGVKSISTQVGNQRVVSLPDTQTRAIRLVFSQKEAERSVYIEGVETLGPEFSSTNNALFANLYGGDPNYPTYWSNKAAYWAIVGAPGDDHEALIGEHGTVEVGKSGFSLEPMIEVSGDHRLEVGGKMEGDHGRDAGAVEEFSLSDGYLPIPSVKWGAWHGRRLTLTTTAFASGPPDESVLVIQYKIANYDLVRRDGNLIVLVRPWQVNPPSQFLNIAGGVSNISHMRWTDNILHVNKETRIIPLRPPIEVNVSSFQSGEIGQDLEKHQRTTVLANGDSLEDASGLASGCLAFAFSVEPLKSETITIAVPFDSKANVAVHTEADAADSLRRTIREWHERLDAVKITLPPSAEHIANTIRSQLAYILINADGPAIQPGSRSYERSWIRDGSMTSSALMEFGLTEQAVEFIDWFGQHLIPISSPADKPQLKVPCVVDKRGPDPVPENDSNGQYIFAVMNAYRFTRDRAILDRHWPNVQKVVNYIEALRAQRLTDEFNSPPPTTATRQEPGKPPVPITAFRGLMPESISHEGYSSKPMHSYWDDFFTLLGLKEAAAMAKELGDVDLTSRYTKIRDEFRTDLYNSLDLTIKAHGIDYIPGCVELGDFDSTSTTIALWPCGETTHLPPALLHNTFDRYWKFATERMFPDSKWDAYTPYELRHVGSFIRLGEVEKAHKLLDWFFTFQRPKGWNHWAEVVFRDADTPKFIGDMPHTWVGSDYINSVRAMLVYEQEDDSLALFAGIPEKWLDEPGSEGVSFNNLPTHFGPLTANIKAKGRDVMVGLEGTANPPGGFIIRSPRGNGIKIESSAQKIEPVEGQPGVWRITGLPATVTFKH